jgi:hypothetical protein
MWLFASNRVSRPHSDNPVSQDLNDTERRKTYIQTSNVCQVSGDGGEH